MGVTLKMKSFLSRLNFSLGNKPRLFPYSLDTVNTFVPKPYKAVVIISCDFELAWAWRFAKQLNCDLKKATEVAKRERENIVLILELCEKFNVPITWAIVGHLFLENCSRKEGRAHIDLIQPTHFENRYWRFNFGEWFDQDPCCNWQEALEWYAPDLIEKILNSKVKHEIACHTFSHIDCREEFCGEELLIREIQECKKTASLRGFKLESFVFPGNFIGNLKILKEQGFKSYRIDKDALCFPHKDIYGLWEIPTADRIGLSPYNWTINYYIKRYKTIIKRAVRYNRMCHFWLHPSEKKEFLEPILTSVLEFMDLNRNNIYISTMNKYVNFLEGKSE